MEIKKQIFIKGYALTSVMETIEIREEDNEELTCLSTDNNLEIWEVIRRLIKEHKKSGKNLEF
jgi:predicted CopG family antitoxin